MGGWKRWRTNGINATELPTRRRAVACGRGTTKRIAPGAPPSQRGLSRRWGKATRTTVSSAVKKQLRSVAGRTGARQGAMVPQEAAAIITLYRS